MATQTPIPPNPIGENFAWRDWLQRLSDRVFGTAATLDVPIEPEYGGTGLTTYNTGDIIYSNSTNNLTRLPPPAATSLLQMTAAGVPSWSASGYGDTLNPYASKTANFVLAAPNGSAGVPTFRAIVAADIPTLNQNTSGSAGSVANSLTSGTGISYSSGTTYNGSTAITINNSGVTSIIAGTGISVSSATGAVTVSQSSATAKKYGAFSDYTSQTIASTTTAYVMTFNTTDLGSHGVSVVSNSRLTVDTTGIYNFQWSGQFESDDNAPQDAYVWIRINGTDVTGSTGRIGLPARKSAGDPFHILAGWNFFLSLNANDYVELVWNATSTSISIKTYAAGTSPTRPSTASLIATFQQL